MICSELYHGQTLAAVIILFRGTSSKYFGDAIACMLMCFVCISSKAGIVRSGIQCKWNQEFHFPASPQEP
jgi:hypothetical protein